MLLPLLLLLLPLKIDSATDSCDLEVKFSSKNFKNILTWSKPIKKGVRYNVIYKTYGLDPWHEKAECTNITHNWCDLTNETSSPSEGYYAEVVINNQDCNISRRTERFTPLFNSVLDPPIVNIFLTSTSLIINLTHVTGDLSSISEAISYEIKITGLGTYESLEPYYKKEILDLPTNVCVSARLIGPTNSNFSNYTCKRTKTDLTSEERIHIMLYVLSASLVIFLVFGAGYSVHKYIYVNNVEKPQILNITSNYNNNIVLVDAHNVTINVIKIESSKSNEKSTMMAEKEEKIQVKTDQYFKDGGCDTSHDSLVTEDDDLGYINLLVQAPVSRPQVSPYDMPHELVSRTSMVSTIPLNNEEDLYGRIKSNTIIASVQKTIEEAYQKANMSEEPFTYLPKNDQNLINPDIVNKELHENEESIIGEAADNIDGADGTDFSDCDTLFVDWSPTSHQLYIPNFHSKAVDDGGTEEDQEVEGLLDHLYKPIQIDENPEELTCLEQKWELHVKMQE